MSAGRPRIVVGATFPFDPPDNGGRLRVFHLCRELAHVAEVVVVCLTPSGSAATERQVAPGLWEWRVPASREHEEAEHALSARVGAPVTDVAFPALEPLTPAYGEALRRAATGAAVLMACHPYAQPALRRVSDAPLWYDAHNVEAALKVAILGDSDEGQRLLDATEAVERTCCEDAEIVLACSPSDARELATRYDLGAQAVRVVPNGIAAVTPFTGPARRRALRRALGLPRGDYALFVGSWHGPNLQAARELLSLAGRRPDLTIWIVGSVGAGLTAEDGAYQAPANATIYGAVNELQKQTMLRLADVAVNPVATGSGSNLKMFEYAACGLPIVTTPRGLRGIAVPESPALSVVALDAFGEAVDALAGRDADELDRDVRRLRSDVLAGYDWRRIGKRLLSHPVVRDRLNLPAMLGAS